MAYEALTGHRPFHGANSTELLGHMLVEEPVSVADLKPETPCLLDRLIRKWSYIKKLWMGKKERILAFAENK
jgi:hypothetical protein